MKKKKSNYPRLVNIIIKTNFIRYFKYYVQFRWAAQVLFEYTPHLINLKLYYLSSLLTFAGTCQYGGKNVIFIYVLNENNISTVYVADSKKVKIYFPLRRKKGKNKLPKV